MLEALPSLLETHPDARLWIGGQGPDEPLLRETALGLRLGQRVDIGAIDVGERAELARHLARVKVVVSMSEFETQPVALLEALSLGCRLVVARSPGLEPLHDAGLASGVSPESTSVEIAEAIASELDQHAPVTPPVLPTWTIVPRR